MERTCLCCELAKPVTTVSGAAVCQPCFDHLMGYDKPAMDAGRWSELKAMGIIAADL